MKGNRWVGHHVEVILTFDHWSSPGNIAMTGFGLSEVELTPIIPKVAS